MEIIEKQGEWDAIVVGSGATGGVAARQLSAAGLRVLVLEAGPAVQQRSDYGGPIQNAGRQLFRSLVSHRQTVQRMHATYWTTNPDFFVDDIDNPYTTPADKPFRWIRGRNLGGRTLTWDGVTPRFSDHEFKAGSRDGLSPDWPLRHADLAPFYAELEQSLGIRGARDGLEQLPDGNYASAGSMTPTEWVLKARVEKRFPQRNVILSRGIGAGRSPRSGQTHTRLSNLTTTLAAAVQTGLVTIRTNAVVSKILVERDGVKATGVEVIDAATHRTEELRARMVFLCASTIESLRILMNSTSRAHPEGIGASSGILGRYLMDHIAGNTYFHMPQVDGDDKNYELLGSDAILIPRFQNLTDEREEYARGFGLWGGVQRFPIPRVLSKVRGEAIGFLCARAEVLPHQDNRVSLDPTVRDAWGLPAARIVFEWKEADLKVASAGRRAAVEMIHAAGGTIADVTDLVHTPVAGGFIRSMQKEWNPSTPGLFVHEVGGARMGESPKDSVVDSFCRTWDTRNVFVTDGACWPSCGWQNPTLTQMAITARACAHAVTELKQSRL